MAEVAGDKRAPGRVSASAKRMRAYGGVIARDVSQGAPEIRRGNKSEGPVETWIIHPSHLSLSFVLLPAEGAGHNRCITKSWTCAFLVLVTVLTLPETVCIFMVITCQFYAYFIGCGGVYMRPETFLGSDI
ncbi:hypothetical protein BABINDRAFT_178333 [Babjeviella inositovora NRRL Y-12698]|uniref:Uncharacterized protein n=1 Tax=Babjeviella inositovora NRRL Y-12698 TaxID=984486 RepID=A0A1E3QHP5_9ASCO|nr:uncharacterized protein BABINDRAFT_178333 [Babjeviella inositovora NRRL Y-12698]ODQ77216.1 hypothetical protein BABINDRAFT_178333 [Babjeviella inositovora NRRL Y-12698]